MRLLAAILLISFTACDRVRPLPKPVCSNGVLEGSELCDDGNSDDSDGCLNSCIEARCGDGIVALTEACDDGNEADSDACLSNCELARCGDSIIGPGEVCDDGNEVDNDGCYECVLAGCGDGDLDGDEACDDGNAVHDDACDTNCQITNQDNYDDDGDCFCEAGPCVGSLSLDCADLSPNDCNDSEATINANAEDLPDLDGIDGDCDGVDGRLENLVFVSEQGSDDDDGLSPATALRSVEAGLVQATEQERPWLLIHGEHTLTAADTWTTGVHIAGGYAANFSERSGRSVLRPPASGLVVTGDARTLWRSLHFRSDDGANGENSTALRLQDLTNLLLEDCRVEAGAGGPGRPGSSGSRGSGGSGGGASVALILVDSSLQLLTSELASMNGGSGGSAAGGASVVVFCVGESFFTRNEIALSLGAAGEGRGGAPAGVAIETVNCPDREWP